MQRHLVIFLRRPQLGRGKTRLAQGIGRIGALKFQRWSSERLIHRLSADPRWKTWLAVTPDQAVLQPDPWGRGGQMIAQGSGDLGRRMARAMHGQRGPVLILGSDQPDVDRDAIWRGFRQLEAHDVVLGPAEDGGYWIVGTKQGYNASRLFQNVRWSSEHTLADTVRNVAAPRTIGYLETRFDIDTADELHRWQNEQNRH